MLYGDGKRDNAKALQKLLDKRGIVVIDKAGKYMVSKTLIIHPNTHLILAPGVEIIAMPFSKCSLIQNESFAGGGLDENIHIEGGVWDGNCDAMGLDGVYEAEHREDFPYSPDLFKGKLMRFANVKNFIIEKLTVKNPVSYGIQIAGAYGYIARDLYFDYNWHFGTTDGVHINGPSYDGLVENLHGTTNDDMVGVTTIDETHAEITKGEIVNLVIKNISAKNGYSGVRLLSAGDYDMRCVKVSGVYGEYRHNAVLISHHNTRPNTKIWFDDILVEDVYSSKSTTPLGEGCFRLWEKDAIETLPIIWIEEGINAGNIILRNISRCERANTKGALIQIDKGAVIDRLIVDNVSQKFVNGGNAPLYINDATITTLIERDIQK